MSIDWNEVKRAVSPARDYQDVCQRLQESFSYPFVRETFNFTMPELAGYTRKMLGGDTRGRYNEYATYLIDVFTELHRAGVRDLQDLIARVETREKLEAFVGQSGVDALKLSPRCCKKINKRMSRRMLERAKKRTT